MPIVRENKLLDSYLIYDAPINEKTEEIRKKFDIDPETGYARHYNWRTLAKLGPEYRPEDALTKLLPFREEQHYTTYIFGAVATVGAAYVFQRGYNLIKQRPPHSRPWFFVLMLGLTGVPLYYFMEQSPRLQGSRNAACLDYVKSHPDRFETKKRLKYREILLKFYPARG